jgi:hypothetical protein
MNSLTTYQKIIKSIRWNAIESIAYHFLLALHQIALFKVLSYEEYGHIGVAFSILYLAVWIGDLGFDAALSTFWFFWSQSKETVRSFLSTNSVPNILFFLCCTFGMALIPTIHGYTISGTLCTISSIALISEIIRRLCKTIMQLLFKNSAIATAELIFMAIYLSLVWGLYFNGITLTVITTLAPLAISSLISTAFCLISIQRWYTQLPHHASGQNDDTPTAMRIARFRFFSYGNAMGSLLFSSNFLVPLFAFKFGSAHAGLLKLASSVVHSITIVLQKTFGNACRALLAHARNVDDMSKSQQYIFITITGYLYQLLYGLLIFCAINHRFLVQASGAADTYAKLLLILFFIISLLDNFAITYEKLYEINERSDILCLFNGLGSLLLIVLVIPTAPLISPVTLLLIIALIRLSLLVLASGMTFMIYRVNPYQTIKPAFILGTIVISLLFFILS